MNHFFFLWTSNCFSRAEQGLLEVFLYLMISSTEVESLTEVVNSFWSALPSGGEAAPNLALVRERLESYMQDELARWKGPLDEFDATPEEVAAAVDALCLEGNAAQEAENYETACNCYRRALQLLPVPFFRYANSARFLLTGLGDILFDEGGHLDIARSVMQLCMFVEGSIDTPYVHWLYGRICLKAGDEKRALYELQIAKEMDESLFEPDDDDDSFDALVAALVDNRTKHKEDGKRR